MEGGGEAVSHFRPRAGALDLMALAREAERWHMRRAMRPRRAEGCASLRARVARRLRLLTGKAFTVGGRLTPATRSRRRCGGRARGGEAADAAVTSPGEVGVGAGGCRLRATRPPVGDSATGLRVLLWCPRLVRSRDEGWQGLRTGGGLAPLPQEGVASMCSPFLRRVQGGRAPLGPLAWGWGVAW